MWVEIFILLVLVLGGILVTLYMLTMFRSDRLEIRNPLSKTGYIKRYWTREVVDKKSGIVSWVNVWCSSKIKVEQPPREILDVDSRGRRYASAYKIAEDQYVWIEDKGVSLKETEKDGVKILEIVDTFLDGSQKIIDTFQPYSVTDRLVVMQEQIKSNEMKPQTWTPDKIILGGVIGVFGITLILGIIFFGDIVSAVQGYNSNTAMIVDKVLYRAEQISTQQAVIMQSLGYDINITLRQVVPPYEGSPTLSGKGEEPPDFSFGLIEGLT